MATVSPSPNSTPSVPPPTDDSTPPQPSATPPPPIPQPQPNANSPDPSTPSTPDAPPPTTPTTPPPVISTPSATPPTASPPPPAPTTDPPVSTPPPPVVPPPTTPATPPTTTPSSPALSPPSPTTPPPSSTPPPPTTSPPTGTPSPPLTSPPESPPTTPSAPPPTSPPPSTNPPADSPPPPAATPPETSPPPAPSSSGNAPPPSPPSQPPRGSPSPPAASPPRGSSTPPGTDSPPPSDPEPVSPPSTTPGPRAPGPPFSPPSPGSETIAPTINLPANRSTPDAPETSNASSSGGLGRGGAVAVGVIAGLLILGLIGLVGLWMYKRKKKSSGTFDGHVIPASIGSSPRSDGKLLVRTEHPDLTFVGGSGTATPSDHGGYGHSKSWFTYQELYDATSGFSDEKLLGEGGFGPVHKGILTDGRVVAVKQLKIGGGQGEREFKAEVEIISRIHHRHLVSLVGYCIWENKRLLVYEYVPNNTLHFHLHGRPVMDWITRVKIAVGAARGITYLHEDCHPRIIHRDIKSSNILLDNNFEARVADFGLAKLAMDAETHVTTRVMGTFGYMAPEYATTGKLTEKSDVYSYGVVLLELITGRKPVDESQPLGDESLVEWARPLLSRALDTGELEGLVDPRLEKNFIESEMLRMIEAAGACVRHSAVKRPRMGLVVRALTMSDSGDLSNGLRVGESQLYDSAQQSAEIRWFRRMAFGSQDISSEFFNNPTQNLGHSGPSRQDVDISAQQQHNRNFPNVRSQNLSWNSGRSSSDRQSQGYRNQSFNRE